MPDIADAVSDTLEDARASRLHSMVAIMVALTATLMALGNIKDGNIVQAMQQSQAHAVDTWAFYQSKSTKQHLAENMIEQADLEALALPPGAAAAGKLAALRERYTAEVRRYAIEKDSVRVAAEADDRLYDALNVHDDQFDLAEACFSVGLATYGISALTRKRWLLGMGILLTIAGAIMTLAGFLGWGLHPGALSRLLG